MPAVRSRRRGAESCGELVVETVHQEAVIRVAEMPGFGAAIASADDDMDMESGKARYSN